MNINPLMKAIGEEMGIPCKQDVYEGPEKRFIVYTYADERAAYYADDDEAEITVNLTVQLITPQRYDYFGDKAELKRCLKNKGFTVESIQSWLDEEAAGTDRARRTIYSVYYTGADN